MTNDQNQKNDQIQMSGPPPHPEAIGHWCLGFLWSFGIGPLSFARSEGLPHPHPDSVVQLAQTAGGDEGARFESGKDLLPPFLHAAELDFLGASSAVLDHKDLGYARKSAHRIERHDECGDFAVEHQFATGI